MRILVIGKTGFIATSLARILLREGHSVVVCGRPELDFLDDHSVDEFLARGEGLNVINFISFPQEEYVSLHTANIDPKTRMIELLIDIFAVAGANELISNSKGLFIQLLRELRYRKLLTMKMLN